MINKMKTINQLMNLDSRKVIITGAAGNLGKVIASTVAELGGELILVDRPGSDYSEILSSLDKSKNISIEIIDCNLENYNERQKLIREVKNNSSSNLNVLINNAAFVGESNLKGWTSKFEDQSIDTWNRAIEVNLTAAFDLSKGFAKTLGINGKGSIINIASIYGLTAPVWPLYEGTDMGNPAAYAVSKGGLLQLTRWLATTVAPDVRVNSISPGGIWRNQPSDFVKKYESRTPLGRMASEEDLKGAIAYLSSDLSSYVTGQNIVVDGGWTV